MTKPELIRGIAAGIDGVTQKDVEAVLTYLPTFVKETFEKDKNEKIFFPGFGTIKVKEMPARHGTSVFTGKEWTKDAYSMLKFTFNKDIAIVK